MRIFIAGSTGLVGRHAVAAALQRGHDVTVLARSVTRFDHALRPRITVVTGDFSATDEIRRALPGHDCVINCAGTLSAPRRDEFAEGNIEGPRRLYRAAREAGVPGFVHVGSMGVYGQNGEPVVTEDTAEERHPDWRGGYTASKLAGDRTLLEESAAGPPALAILRPAMVYGAGAALPLGRLSKAMAGRLVLVGGRPRTLFPLVYAGNLADALLNAAERRVTGVFNVVDDPDLTQGEFHRVLRSVLPRAPQPMYVPAGAIVSLGRLVDLGLRLAGRRSHVAYRLDRTLASFKVDTARAAGQLAYRPRITLPDALRRTSRP